jgi:glycosyltransferase involved in cell wall biosynthesis
MSNNPEISIIVPIYNTEKYLHKCIDSILVQSFRNFELILVDDGSTDESGSICDKYAKKDSRIIVVHKDNSGVSNARNAGLDITKGKFIGFVDSDDWIHKDMYKIMYDAICRYNAGIAECRKAKAIDDNIEDEPLSDIEHNILTNLQASENLFAAEKNNSVVVWNKLYKKNIFDNLRFKKGVVHEDNFFTYIALYKAIKIVNINCALYYHRKTENSITNSTFGPRKLAAVDAYLEAMSFYREKKLNRLHDLALFYLMDIIRWDYYCTHEHIFNKEVKKKCILKLRSVFKENYILAIRSKHISIKSKIAFTTFLILPFLYNLYYYVKIRLEFINEKETNKIT